MVPDIERKRRKICNGHATANGVEDSDEASSNESVDTPSSEASDPHLRSASKPVVAPKGSIKRRGKKKKNIPSKTHPSLQFKCTGHWKEDHMQPIFGVSINHWYDEESDPIIFATAGSNRVSIYEALDDGKIRLIQCYADPDTEESFYTCAWSYNTTTGDPIVAVAGVRGIIRVLCLRSNASIKHFLGHGQCINELIFHPTEPAILLSVSKDHNLRLWNVDTDHCIAIFGGVEGHRDEVISADFDAKGETIISCGMDHSLKIWRLNTLAMKSAIKMSYSHDTAKLKVPFPTMLNHFPDFSTRDIHRNYIDCCRWYGQFVLSKALESGIICWKPGVLTDENSKETSEATIITKFDYDNCELWFVRFCLDSTKKFLALGNQKGVTYVWDIGGGRNSDNPSRVPVTTLSHPKCTSTIRQTILSRDGRVLICVCDDSTIWRWDRLMPSMTNGGA